MKASRLAIQRGPATCIAVINSIQYLEMVNVVLNKRTGFYRSEQKTREKRTLSVSIWRSRAEAGECRKNVDICHNAYLNDVAISENKAENEGQIMMSHKCPISGSWISRRKP